MNTNLIFKRNIECRFTCTKFWITFVHSFRIRYFCGWNSFDTDNLHKIKSFNVKHMGTYITFSNPEFSMIFTAVVVASPAIFLALQVYRPDTWKYKEKRAVLLHCGNLKFTIISYALLKKISWNQCCNMEVNKALILKNISFG